MNLKPINKPFTKFNRTRTRGIGIFKSKDWFKDLKNYNWAEYVVGSFSNFNDGENDHFESYNTLAVVVDLEHAKLIFSHIVVE